MLPPKAAGSLFLLTGVSILHLSTLHPTRDLSGPDATLDLPTSDEAKDLKHLQKADDDNDDDGLFGDLEPQQLANILVKSLRSKDKIRRENEEEKSVELDSRQQERGKDAATEDVTSRTIIQTLDTPTKQPSSPTWMSRSRKPCVRKRKNS
ncbi:hypothetical protein WMY93_014021 [Mugilogobius chulae]|uniref:Uncharacterized protein n=1 Tax=Mugilogobius chulae TaxID=88201 RepID=A0AAW0P0C0_9GOBI